MKNSTNKGTYFKRVVIDNSPQMVIYSAERAMLVEVTTHHSPSYDVGRVPILAD